MAVPLLVGADRHLGHVRVHRAVGQHEHDVAAARTARVPLLQFERAEIGDEVRLPHVPAGPHRQEGAVAFELLGPAEPLGERLRVVPDELLVPEHVQDERQVRHCHDARRLGAAPVVVAVRAVQRDREQAAGLPFKGVPLARRRLDARASAAGEDVHDRFVEVALRRGLAARRDLDDLHVDEVAATGEVREGALRLEPRPRCQVELQEIEAEALVDGDLFLRHPLLVRIDQESRLVHRVTVSRAGCGARRWPHFFRVSRFVSASGPIATGN